MTEVVIGDAASRFVVHHGDNMAVLPTLADCSVDAIVTDPPAGISFMGRAWDSDKGGRDAWIAWLTEVMSECLRVLKPGGHALVWAIPRTSHWTGMAIENAGFEVRDRIAHCFGSGFPKSLSVSKAIDKARHAQNDVRCATAWIAEHATARALDAAAGTNGMGGHWTTQGVQAAVPTLEAWARIKHLFPEPPDWFMPLVQPARKPGEAWQTAEVLAVDRRMNEASGIVSAGRDERVEIEREIKAANSDAARQWQGFGTSLKPAIEDWWLARKPLSGTVAANVLQFGTGALNIDSCRVGTTDQLGGGGENLTPRPHSDGWDRPWMHDDAATAAHSAKVRANVEKAEALGRWPANLIISIPEDEYVLRDDVTPGQLRQLADWIDENA